MPQVLASRLRIVAEDLIGTEQNYAMKERSIQNNLHMVCEIRECIEDNTEASLINLDLSKAFDQVDRRFLTAVLETVGVLQIVCLFFVCVFLFNGISTFSGYLMPNPSFLEGQ